jgi:hypothetical protein
VGRLVVSRARSLGARVLAASALVFGVAAGALPTSGVPAAAAVAPAAQAGVTVPSTVWSELSPPASPPERSGAATVFDRSTGDVVLFGGLGAGGALLGDTWTWNGTTWAARSPAASPPARTGAAVAYDAATGDVLLFGGNGAGTGSAGSLLGDTWSWNGATWTQLDPSSSPSARSGASIAYDPATGEVVLVGGAGTGGNPLGDTWSWNGATWTQLDTPVSPMARLGASLAYDPATGSLLLFGGFGIGGTPLSDTWTWDGANWSELSPPANPPARWFASTAFDPATGALLLFGGTSGALLDDTWMWDGATWTEVGAGASSPGGRSGASAAYDPSTGAVLLFGGTGAGGELADTWTWGFVPGGVATWSESTPLSSPSARDEAPMAYDPATGDMVLFAGSPNDRNDTWTWNGTTWTQVDDGGAPGCSTTCPDSPSARRDPSMAFDPATGQMVLFGGFDQAAPAFLGDTWSWNGSAWVQLSPAGTPSPRLDASMAYDPATGQLLLFGGYGTDGYLADTWVWNGSTWSELSTPVSPSPREAASIAYDPVTGQMVLFGGVGASGWVDDTWTWNGVGWTQLAPATSPDPLDASIAYDPATGDLVVLDVVDNVNTTWTWNGSTWTEQRPLSEPPALGSESMAFDPATASVLVFGGYDGSNYVNETWQWAVTAVPPAAPAAATAAPGSASMSLTWGVPVSSGGWPVQGYDVYLGTSPGHENYSSPVASLVPGTSYTVTGLTDGTTYYATVEAVNAVGKSVPSAEVSAVAGAPGAPNTVRARAGATGTPGDGQAVVSWTAAAPHAAPVTGYLVVPLPVCPKCTGLAVGAGVRSTTVTGLRPGVSYTFAVSAANASGRGPAGVSGRVRPTTLPTAPTRLAASRSSAGVIKLSWSPPATTGGTTITGYVVASVPACPPTQCSGLGLLGASVRSTTIRGLSRTTAYRFLVKAENADGLGPAAETGSIRG